MNTFKTICTTNRVERPSVPPIRRRQGGFSIVETSLAMGIVGILGALGVSMVDFGSQALNGVQQEFQGSLHEAFHLAWAQGKDVVVALGEPNTPGIVPVRLPAKVYWGKPVGIPAPPGMDEPKVAGLTGSAHHRITVTPRHTATASAWFVNDGRDVVCMRVSGRGHIQILHWHKSTKHWSLC
jgi:hypothetical protein